MKLNKKNINYVLLLTTVVFFMTACGGGSGGTSSSCLSGVKDSDGDGFHDAIDIAPNDASIPGDFSTPEKILASTKVKYMLKKAKENDVDVRIDLGHNPPNLTGYYRSKKGGNAGSIIDGAYVLPFIYYGAERRICTVKERYEEYGSPFSLNRGAISPYTRKHAMLRGSNSHFTTYEPRINNCFGNSKKRLNSININSSTLNGNGDIVEIKSITVTLYKESGCNDDRSVVSNYTDNEKIKDLDELEYMCVDDKKAYIPTETWKNKDKESCTCTKDVEIECK